MPGRSPAPETGLSVGPSPHPSRAPARAGCDRRLAPPFAAAAHRANARAIADGAAAAYWYRPRRIRAYRRRRVQHVSARGAKSHYSPPVLCRRHYSGGRAAVSNAQKLVAVLAPAESSKGGIEQERLRPPICEDEGWRHSTPTMRHGDAFFFPHRLRADRPSTNGWRPKCVSLFCASPFSYAAVRRMTPLGLKPRTLKTS
jgi:hypothetical protein